MDFIVLGAGAIGSLYGAKLAPRHSVTLIGNAEHVRAINERGLRIEGCEQIHVRVPALDQIRSIAPNTVVLLTTKVTDSVAALGPIADLVREDTTIVCLQNGIGSEAVAREALARRGVVLRGIHHGGALFSAPGRITWMTRGLTVIEPHERSSAIVAALNGAGLEARVGGDMRAEVWRKLVINCVVNPITSITGTRVGGIVTPALDPVKRLVIDECVAVAAAEKVHLKNDFLKHINSYFAPSRNVASMLQDLRRGRPTEMDYLNAAVVSLGAQHGIDCPVNRALSDIIRAMERRGASLFPEEMLEP